MPQKKRMIGTQKLMKLLGKQFFFMHGGGAKNINSYIKWASDEVKKRHNITVKHVKVSDTANVVSRILSEKMLKKIIMELSI